MQDISGQELKYGDLVVYSTLGVRLNFDYNYMALVISNDCLWTDMGVLEAKKCGLIYLARMTKEEQEYKQKLIKKYNDYYRVKSLRLHEANLLKKPGDYGIFMSDKYKGRSLIPRGDINKTGYVVYLGRVRTYWSFIAQMEPREREQLDPVYREAYYAYAYCICNNTETGEACTEFLKTGVFDMCKEQKFMADICVDITLGKIDRMYEDCEISVQGEPLDAIEEYIGTCKFANWNIGDKIKLDVRDGESGEFVSFERVE